MLRRNAAGVRLFQSAWNRGTRDELDNPGTRSVPTQELMSRITSFAAANRREHDVATDAYLIQVLLPVRDNNQVPFDRKDFQQVSAELTERFGGATAFVRSPAEGLWAKEDGTQLDEVIIIETMADNLDEGWWSSYRQQLEKRFRQESIVVRSQRIRTL